MEKSFWWVHFLARESLASTLSPSYQPSVYKVVTMTPFLVLISEHIAVLWEHEVLVLSTVFDRK